MRSRRAGVVKPPAGQGPRSSVNRAWGSEIRVQTQSPWPLNLANMLAMSREPRPCCFASCLCACSPGCTPVGEVSGEPRTPRHGAHATRTAKAGTERHCTDPITRTPTATIIHGGELSASPCTGRVGGSRKNAGVWRSVRALFPPPHSNCTSPGACEGVRITAHAASCSVPHPTASSPNGSTMAGGYGMSILGCGPGSA